MIYLYEYGEALDMAALQAAVSCFPVRLRQDFSGISRQEVLCQHVSAWLLMQEAIKMEYGISSLDILEIDRTGKGKPYSRSYPQVRFNISHCAAACAAAVSVEEVGVDVERKFAYRPALARKVCHAEEWEYLNSLPDMGTERAEVLHMLWSAKESLVKLEGSGLAYGMDRLNLMPLIRKIKQENSEKEGEAGRRETVVRQEMDIFGIGRIELMVQGGKNYTLAACAREPGQKIIRIKKLTGIDTSV